MMIGVAFSRGAFSIRITPSMGSPLPVWAVMSSSAGSDIGHHLLVERMLLGGFQKWRERRHLVRGALNAHHGRAVVRKGSAERPGQLGGIGDVDRRKPGK